MDKRIICELWNLGCDLYFEESLAHHVNFRLGGEVPLLIVPSSKIGFIETLKLLRNEEIDYRILGNGTNILPTDERKKFVVVSTERIDEIEISEAVVYASAGVSFKSLCLAAFENSLSGLEKAFGLPGSVGGAIYMNAGCYGWETAENVLSIEVFDGKEIFEMRPDEAKFGYRSSVFKQNKSLIVLGATFKLVHGERDKIWESMVETMRKRYEKQPLEYPSAGSVFKRPRPDFYVGTAIESLGLKGYQIGGAQISEKHAGFIINRGNAKASDVLELIDYVKSRVKEHYSIELETEIEIWD
ncbi:MAG: UDP-N-acetylmuramate dehydrogenase [Fervidobacterium sp.]|uniref:UDP-N-acetylmuramate dehydrogenase n=1 Tax=Fervidobacterium sp. TaxID=1871331 RepID=UPI004049704B